MKREEIVIPIELIHEDAKLPTYANDGDSGADVYALEDIEIYPQETVIVRTGIKVAIPEGFEIQVRARSGVSLKTPLRVANGIGTIDNGFTNEVGVIINNQSTLHHSTLVYDINQKGNKHGIYRIKKGDRIAQLVLQRVPKMQFQHVESVADISEDRGGGFGSTGTK